MKILCFSDVHSDAIIMSRLLEIAKSVDALCCGGDLLSIYQNLLYQIHLWHDWFQEVGKPIALCGGNHDYLESELSVRSSVMSETPAKRIELLQPYFLASRWIHAAPLAPGSAKYPGTSFLQANGERILVTSIPYEADREEALWLEGQNQRQPQIPWIVLRHDPPALCALSEPSTGSKFARRYIQRYQPDYLLCGHIHSAPFSSKTCWCKIGQTIGVNAGASENKISYALLDTRTRSVDWYVETP